VAVPHQRARRCPLLQRIGQGSAPRTPARRPRVDRFRSPAACSARAKCPPAFTRDRALPTPCLRSSTKFDLLFFAGLFCDPTSAPITANAAPGPSPGPFSVQLSALWRHHPCRILVRRRFEVSGPPRKSTFRIRGNPPFLRVRWPAPIRAATDCIQSREAGRLLSPASCRSLLSAVRFSRSDPRRAPQFDRVARPSAGRARPPGPARRISRRTKISPAAELYR